MGRLAYGTSSWSEPSWEGAFYPAGTPPGEFLTYYATRFSTVEADVTYYRVPDRKLVAGWDRKTPGGFVLSAKFPRAVVHGGDGEKPDPEKILKPGPELDRFLESMRLLGKKCGPLVLQFPYFNKTVFPGPEPFLERLDGFLGRLPGEFRYGVEIRNKNYFAEPLRGVLKKHRTALVLAELSYLPHPADVAKKLDVVTADFSYVRLIGDRKAIEEKTKRFDRIVMDRTAELRRTAELIRDLLGRVEVVYAYANNHYAGHGPATIRELAALVGTG